MASRVGVMDHGRLVQIGAPAEIYDRPASRFVAEFVGEVNMFEGRVSPEAGGPVLVVEGLGAIPLPGDTAAAGAAALLALRPERLRLARGRPQGFAVAATVVSIGYMGSTSLVHLAAGDRRLKALLPGAAAAGLERGSAVWASWSPADSVVIRA